MKKLKIDQLTKVQRCAVMLIAMGVERASRVLGKMTELEVELVSREIAEMEDLPAAIVESVVQEYYQMMISNQYVVLGGKDFTRNVLEKTWDTQKADQFLKQLNGSNEEDVFERLDKVDEKTLLGVLMREHPQTNAIILANMSPGRAAVLLASLPAESQYEIAYRMATMQRTPPELVDDVKTALENELKLVFDDDPNKVGGIPAVADILNSLSGAAEKNIIGNLRERQPELAAAITELMFAFADIVLISDKAVQRLLKDVDSKKLALALKTAGEDLNEKIFKNMSERASKMLKDDIEFLGSVRLKEVEDAQREVVEALRRLEEAGEISISRTEEELIE